MPLEVRCQCGTKLQVPSKRAGTQIRCPKCAETVEVPKLAANKGAGASKPSKRSEGKVASAPQPPPLPVKQKPVEPVGPTPPAVPPAEEPPSSAAAADDSSPLRPSNPPPLPQTAAPTPDPPPAPPPVSEKVAAASSTFQGEDETEPLGGVEHEPGKIWTACQLAAMVVGLAALGAYPAVAEVVAYYRDLGATSIPHWVYLVFFISGLQLVYALYLFQLPDWSSVWVVMIVNACLATLYATFMGVALVAGDGHGLIQALELGDLQQRGYLSLWCFLMTLVTATATYFLIRFSLSWHRAYETAMLANEP